MSGRIWSVSEVNALIQSLLDGDERFSGIYVRGELSNYKIYPSGHHYFTIKDGEATLKAVMFRREASRLRFRPENGMKVIALGRVTVYPRDGAYQLYVSDLTPDGVGDLHIAFEQLKAKLQTEGLFDREHKKPLPPYPRRIAVVTSGAGAAVRDIIRVSTKRYPLAKLMILPVRVQGAEAPAEIVSAIRFANRHALADLIIAGRGGGSMEDLWAFNDERVARAIYASEIPVISAVGHEPDVTIADFVADRRAATPSNAAEIAVPDQAELLESIEHCRKRLEAAMTSRLERERLRLRRLRDRRVLRDPGVYLGDRSIALDRLTERLDSSVRQLIARRRSVDLDRLSDRLGASVRMLLTRRRTAFASRAAALDALSPLKVLGRGYSIALRADGTLVRSRSQVRPGDRLDLRVAEGRIPCAVLEEGEDDSDGRE